MEERIMTLHPEGKQGVNIHKKKYDHMRRLILELLAIHQPIGFMPLCKLIDGELEGTFDGSVTWYYTTVKLDLEARGLLKRQKVKGKELLVLAEAE